MKENPNQSELPLLFCITPRRAAPEPKAEPHRNELDGSCNNAQMLLRAAVENPTPRNIQALNRAIIEAHRDLLTLNFVENNLAHECQG